MPRARCSRSTSAPPRACPATPPPRPAASPGVRSCRYARTVARDNTVQLGARWLGLPRRRSYAGCRVELRECLDGRLLVFAHGALLAAQPSPWPDFVLTPRQAPSRDRRSPRAHSAVVEVAQDPRSPAEPLAQAPRTAAPALLARRPSRPAPTHPWRRAVTRRGRELQTL